MASPTKNATIHEANSTKESMSDRTEHSQTRNPFQAVNRNRKKGNQIQIKLLQKVRKCK